MTSTVSQKVRKELAKRGIETSGVRTAGLVELVAQVWHVQPVPRQQIQGYLGCWLDSLKPKKRNVAGPRYRPPFRPLKYKPHLRQDEMDALPKRISMPWDGTNV